MRLKSKRLVSLLLAGSMMVSMVPASAVTAFAAEAKSGVVAYAEVVPTVTVSVSGGLQAAVQAKYSDLDSITELIVKTENGATLNKTDFQFLSGVVVTGEEGANCTAEYAGASDASETTKSISYLKNLETLDLTDTQCENNTFPPRAFCKNTKIKVVIFPDTLQSSGFKTFAFATALEYVGIRAGLGASSETSTIKFPASMTKIGESCFYGDTGLKCKLELPATLTTLGTNAFEGASVSGEITIHKDTKFEEPAPGQKSTIHNATFRETNITAITFEDGIESIPTTFAENCGKLVEINIPNSVSTIGASAFRYSYEKYGNAPETKAFAKDLVIPESVETIGAGAFSNIGKVKNIIVENANVDIKEWAFAWLNTNIYFKSAQEQNDSDTGNKKWNNSTTIHATILNTDGGEVAPSSNETYKDTGLYIPTKEGYRFEGWYDADDNELTTAAVAGQTYTAKWAKLYTVTFADADVDSVQVAEGKTVEEPENPKKDEYKFDGWYKDKDYTEVFDFDTETITDNTTIYAKWRKYNLTTTVEETANTDQKNEIGKPVDIAITLAGDTADFDIAKLSLNFDKPEAVKEVKLTVNSFNDEEINASADLTKYAGDNYQHMNLSDDEEESSDIALQEAMPESITVKMTLSVVYSAGGKNNVEIVFEDDDNHVVSKKTAEVEVAYAPESLTLTACTAKLEDGTTVESGTKVDVGAKVTVTFDKDFYADSNLVLSGWKVTPDTLTDVNSKLVKDITADSFTFVMPEAENGVTIEALTKTADTEDDSWDAATVVTGVAIGAGAAVLTYHIGTELYAEQVLGKSVAVPKTREDVALKAWELAGKPAVELNGEPLSEAAQAEKWAVESGLMQNVDGSFNGQKKMSKLKALRVLDSAKKMG